MSLQAAFCELDRHYEVSNLPVYLVDNSNQVTKADYQGLITSDSKDGAHLEIHHISGQGNIGYGRAHNLILDSLTSDFHLVLNPDVVIDEKALVNALSIIIQDNNIIGISPNAENLLGEKQYLCKRYPSVLTLFIRGFLFTYWKRFFKERLSHYEMRELSDKEYSKGIELISGCFMFLDTRIFKKINGFCESYFLYFEVFDLSIRMRKHGELVYAPKVHIKHSGGDAAKKGASHILTFIKSGYKFFNAHGWRFF